MLELLFLHVLGDFPLQGKYLSDRKCDEWLAMTIHCFIYGALFYLVAHVSAPAVITLMVVHYAVDSSLGCGNNKCEAWNGACLPQRKLLILDQALHMIPLVIIYLGWL